MSVYEVRYLTPFLDRAVSFFGHTHVQGTFWIHRNGVKRKNDSVLDIETDAYYLINPGSVGQPRDGDRRAAYAIYDTKAQAVQFHRVTYDVQAAQVQILSAGLPEMLALRLDFGR